MNPRTAALLAAVIALGIVISAVVWIAQGAVAGLITAGWGWVTIAAFHFGFRRSDAVQIAGAAYLGRRGGWSHPAGQVA
jgi:hypothetical protein